MSVTASVHLFVNCCGKRAYDRWDSDIWFKFGKRADSWRTQFDTENEGKAVGRKLEKTHDINLYCYSTKIEKTNHAHTML